MFRNWSTYVLMLLFLPFVALAQNTGKIAGRVTDAASGQPLPGATVRVEGTQLGAAADANGNYFIIGVPVGAYNVKASFVGYTDKTEQQVRISTGYTTELNFSLRESSDTNVTVDIVYERPLIQKDAVGAPKIVSGGDIQNLPVRGVQNVTSLQAGVVSDERGGSLNARGGRDGEVTVYVDGVKTSLGRTAVPQAAISEQEMLIGNISARYGDAMSGIINVTTRSGSPEFFGTLEGVTSQFLDPYGYNLAEASIGGPIVKNKVSFFLGGSYLNTQDNNPAWNKFPTISRELMDQMKAQPQVLFIKNGDKTSSVALPVDQIPTGAILKYDTGGHIVMDGNKIFFTKDGKDYGVDIGTPTFDTITLREAAEVLPTDQYTLQARRYDPLTRLALNGNLRFDLTQAIALRVGGRYFQSSNGGTGSGTSSFFNYDYYGKGDETDVQGFATWTHRLSNSTFYQIQADWSNYKYVNYHPGFSSNIEDVLHYGDIDNPANEVLKRYRTFSGSGTNLALSQFATDGLQEISTAAVNGFYMPTGFYNVGYGKGRTSKFHVSAEATTQIGLHQLQFGAEYEQQEARAWGIGAGSANVLARAYKDGSIEPGFPTQISAWNELKWSDLNQRIGYYGYNFLGTEETNEEDVDTFMANIKNANADPASFNTAPWRPIFYGGFVQDKIEYKDLVLNIGLRADVFDNNNALKLLDPYAAVPLVRAGEISSRPANIGENFAVYFEDGDSKKAVTGFRDLEGNFYTKDGSTSRTVPTGGVSQKGTMNSSIFEDYKPAVALMPRIGLSFPVTDQASFFARYGVTAQRPGNWYKSLFDFYRFAVDNVGNTQSNAALTAPRTIEYEIGFRRRLGQKIAFQLSGFYRQQKDQVSIRILNSTAPWSSWSTRINADFASVTGVETGFEMRRTNGLAINANYTISFAEGTGSDAGTFGNVAWLFGPESVWPNFLNRMDFDQRHKATAQFDYRLGKGEGPEIGGMNILENFGFNLVVQYGSGRPYTKRTKAVSLFNSVARANYLQGGINTSEMPSYTRLDLKVDRQFKFGDSASFTAFLEAQNLLNAKIIRSVYGFTGLADNDGFLDSEEGRALYGNDPILASQYGYRVNNTGQFGVPRTVRLGLRVNL